MTTLNFDYQFFDSLETILGADYNWQPAPNLSLGCWSTNSAFVTAKEKKANPNQIALELTVYLNSKLTASKLNYLVAVQSGPYVNLQLTDLGLTQYLGTGVNKISQPHQSQKLILEYICPNIAKPLHAGHLLQANYAIALQQIMMMSFRAMHARRAVLTNNYWGDWGVQFGILIWAWKRLQGQVVKVSINGVEESLDISQYDTDPVMTLVKLYVWGSNQKEKVENWKDLVRQEHKALESGDATNRELRNKFFEDSKVAVEATIKRLDIPKFDYNLSESSVEPIIPQVLNYIKANNIGTADGLGWYVDSDFFVSKGVEIPNFGRCYLVQSKDGYTTYALRDICAKIMFAENFNYDKYITFVGNEQIHHFRQVYGILDYMNLLPDFETEFGKTAKKATKKGNLETIYNGMVTLPSGKMKTREGKFITANDILDTLEAEARRVIETKQIELGNPQIDPETLETRTQAIALSAIKWFNLSRDIAGESILDMQTILKFEGNTGVYQLYTYARLNSILTKNNYQCRGQDEEFVDISKFDVSKLNELEKQLLTKTIYLNDTVSKITKNYKVHLLTNHLYEVSTMINNWYAKHSVSTETDPSRKASMLTMCELLKNHLGVCLSLLRIRVLNEL